VCVRGGEAARRVWLLGVGIALCVSTKALD
jgi:hypothetical protein